ncbi:MAG TPA: DUF2203 domain-containing protein [Polyangia bacterium]|nr:DUF2203 domain-containing protein [Polyangia bacterium]
MARSHFTVDEIEGLIPGLEQIFVRVLQMRAGLRALGEKLDRAGVKSRDVETETESGPPAVRQARAVFRGLDEALADELENVRALGGEVKDVDLGLVDFPGTREGEKICLCWKLGEKRVAYWHSLDGGYASRRPIDEHVLAEPSRVD